MQPIERKKLVSRHNPILRQPEKTAPLSVGNGELAYTVDVTGMQSYPDAYVFPLGTQSHWGWHSTGGRNIHTLEQLQLESFDTHGRDVGYPTNAAGQEEAFHWLRQNPHRVQLGTFGLDLRSQDGKPIELDELQDIEQTLDLWRGVISSRFRAGGAIVNVVTACHPDADQIGIRIESPLIAEGRLSIIVRFPAPHPQARGWGSSIGLNWGDSLLHASTCRSVTRRDAQIERVLDEDTYHVRMAWTAGDFVQEEPHAFRVIPDSSLERLEFAISLSPIEAPACEDVDDIIEASRRHWAGFWQRGGALELAGSRDPRASELERRVVLSQFLTALHSAGSLPPQETGLMYNSWFGKFHLEMHWWHAAHFAQWGRVDLLRKSMDWYSKILPKARALAVSQGYEGARWPKMVGPEGDQSPSNVGALLIWQQPHPIDLAELCFQAEPTRETLERYRDIVMESARFMASYVVWEQEGSRYVLGPPVIPAQENHRGDRTMNPTFELEYWFHGLGIALEWRRRLGLPPDPRWEHVRANLSRPHAMNGTYEAHELISDTFESANIDHPSMLGACGILPGKLVDRETMLRTLYRVRDDWKWETSWGWDFPMAAMAAARLGEPALAVDMLMMDQVKNSYLVNGHNYQRDHLLSYLPGNGGLLATVALMAAGWIGGPGNHAPGFPGDGTWSVRYEGLVQRL
ncbi:glycoside hydrolase family 65 [Paenibacillus sp. XY044]|uniref:glycoside hydrolase family 65 n=1 Tax=Paenibacillus sp. XY044 TaxID=2026089 RepID=UPI000B980654|nr:glycoside hydrolase family 65 [Paenibacillus sp. XY044]OZB98877.1 glycoside hydrolase family 65 [Paenibacillus sp. XY044]